MEQFPFFVYGTLLPGQPNDHLWSENAITQEDAVFVNGRLYDMGFYPMLVEEAGFQVKGVLLTVQPETYQDVIAALDSLEGFDPANPDVPGYQRVTREVWRENGRSAWAWIYIGQADYVKEYFPIPNGDWRQYASDKFDDITDWWEDIDTIIDPPVDQAFDTNDANHPKTDS